MKTTSALKPRRRLLIPTVPQARSARRPDEDAAERRMRDALKRNAADAIAAVVGQSRPGDKIGGIELTERLGEPDSWGRRRREGTIPWLERKGAAMRACREVRAFREAQCGQYEVVPVSCKTRVCPDCERSRSARVVRAVTAILEQVRKDRCSYSVLTIRNTRELLPGLVRLDRAVASLRRRPLFSGGRCRWRTRDGRPGHPCGSAYCSRWRTGRHRGDRNCPDFRHPPVLGGGRFTEVTYNLRERTWHPHANLLLDAPYIVQAELSDLWRAITCSDPTHRRAGWCPASCAEGSSMVHIKRVRAGTIREAVKYVTKAADLIEGDDPQQLVEFMLATRGRRMVQGFGSFFGLELVDDELPEGATVTKLVESAEHDRLGRAIFIRFKLPRVCRQCGRDTKLGDDCTYEDPVVAPRADVRLRNGFPSWRPRPRAPA